jgi:hypothetical protein
MSVPVQELVVKSLLNAASAPDLPGRTREDAVREGVSLLVQAVTGQCQRTGLVPAPDTRCECVPCRAWRAEKAEGQVEGLQRLVASANADVEAAQGILEAVKADRDDAKAANAAYSVALEAEKAAHEDTGAQLAKARTQLQSKDRVIDAFQVKLDTANGVIESLKHEIERLARIEAAVSAFRGALDAPKE